MRIPCEVIISRYKANSRQAPTSSKAKKGFIVLQKLRQTPPKYQITFAVAGDKTGNKFDLDKPPIILDHFIKTGKITMTFPTTPAVMVCVSKACPSELGQLIDCIKRISEGENVEVEKVKVKNTDFKPSTITVSARKDYKNQMNNCSNFLKTLKIEPIGLRMPDTKWIECQNITSLTLSENPIGISNRNLDVFSKLKNLQNLELKNCSLGYLPIFSFCNMIRELPKTLASIDLSENQLKVFPPLFHILQLRTINVAFNNIKYLPSRIGSLQNLVNINLSQNEMSSLPYIFPRIRSIQNVGLNANDELVRLREEIGPLIVRWLTTKVDHQDYTHYGGVDTLMTIASNAVHRDKRVMKASRQFLPLSVRFQMDDLMYEKPGVSSLEMCTSCLRLRHIRIVRPQLVQSKQIANTVDVIDRFVIFDNLLCIDCYRPAPTVGIIPIQQDFFKFAV